MFSSLVWVLAVYRSLPKLLDEGNVGATSYLGSEVNRPDLLFAAASWECLSPLLVPALFRTPGETIPLLWIYVRGRESPKEMMQY